MYTILKKKRNHNIVCPSKNGTKASFVPSIWTYCEKLYYLKDNSSGVNDLTLTDTCV
jgi:hypothetical protein